MRTCMHAAPDLARSGSDHAQDRVRSLKDATRIGDTMVSKDRVPASGEAVVPQAELFGKSYVKIACRPGAVLSGLPLIAQQLTRALPNFGACLWTEAPPGNTRFFAKTLLCSRAG